MSSPSLNDIVAVLTSKKKAKPASLWDNLQNWARRASYEDAPSTIVTLFQGLAVEYVTQLLSLLDVLSKNAVNKPQCLALVGLDAVLVSIPTLVQALGGEQRAQILRSLKTPSFRPFECILSLHPGLNVSVALADLLRALHRAPGGAESVLALTTACLRFPIARDGTAFANIFTLARDTLLTFTSAHITESHSAMPRSALLQLSSFLDAVVVSCGATARGALVASVRQDLLHTALNGPSRGWSCADAVGLWTSVCTSVALPRVPAIPYIAPLERGHCDTQGCMCSYSSLLDMLPTDGTCASTCASASASAWHCFVGRSIVTAPTTFDALFGASSQLNGQRSLDTLLHRCFRGIFGDLRAKPAAAASAASDARGTLADAVAAELCRLIEASAAYYCTSSCQCGTIGGLRNTKAAAVPCVEAHTSWLRALPSEASLNKFFSQLFALSSTEMWCFGGVLSRAVKGSALTLPVLTAVWATSPRGEALRSQLTEEPQASSSSFVAHAASLLSTEGVDVPSSVAAFVVESLHSMFLYGAGRNEALGAAFAALSGPCLRTPTSALQTAFPFLFGSAASPLSNINPFAADAVALSTPPDLSPAAQLVFPGGIAQGFTSIFLDIRRALAKAVVLLHEQVARSPALHDSTVDYLSNCCEILCLCLVSSQIQPSIIAGAALSVAENASAVIHVIAQSGSQGGSDMVQKSAAVAFRPAACLATSCALLFQLIQALQHTPFVTKICDILSAVLKSDIVASELCANFPNVRLKLAAAVALCFPIADIPIAIPINPPVRRWAALDDRRQADAGLCGSSRWGRPFAPCGIPACVQCRETKRFPRDDVHDVPLHGPAADILDSCRLSVLWCTSAIPLEASTQHVDLILSNRRARPGGMMHSPTQYDATLTPNVLDVILGFLPSPKGSVSAIFGHISTLCSLRLIFLRFSAVDDLPSLSREVQGSIQVVARLIESDKKRSLVHLAPLHDIFLNLHACATAAFFTRAVLPMWPLHRCAVDSPVQTVILEHVNYSLRVSNSLEHVFSFLHTCIVDALSCTIICAPPVVPGAQLQHKSAAGGAMFHDMRAAASSVTAVKVSIGDILPVISVIGPIHDSHTVADAVQPLLVSVNNSHRVGADAHINSLRAARCLKGHHLPQIAASLLSASYAVASPVDGVHKELYSLTLHGTENVLLEIANTMSFFVAVGETQLETKTVRELCVESPRSNSDILSGITDSVVATIAAVVVMLSIGNAKTRFFPSLPRLGTSRLNSSSLYATISLLRDAVHVTGLLPGTVLRAMLSELLSHVLSPAGVVCGSGSGNLSLEGNAASVACHVRAHILLRHRVPYLRNAASSVLAAMVCLGYVNDASLVEPQFSGRYAQPSPEVDALDLELDGDGSRCSPWPHLPPRQSPHLLYKACMTSKKIVLAHSFLSEYSSILQRILTLKRVSDKPLPGSAEETALLEVAGAAVPSAAELATLASCEINLLPLCYEATAVARIAATLVSVFANIASGCEPLREMAVSALVGLVGDARPPVDSQEWFLAVSAVSGVATVALGHLTLFARVSVSEVSNVLRLSLPSAIATNDCRVPSLQGKDFPVASRSLVESCIQQSLLQWLSQGKRLSHFPWAFAIPSKNLPAWQDILGFTGCPMTSHHAASAAKTAVGCFEFHESLGEPHLEHLEGSPLHAFRIRLEQPGSLRSADIPSGRLSCWDLLLVIVVMLTLQTSKPEVYSQVLVQKLTALFGSNFNNNSDAFSAMTNLSPAILLHFCTTPTFIFRKETEPYTQLDHKVPLLVLDAAAEGPSLLSLEKAWELVALLRSHNLRRWIGFQVNGSIVVPLISLILNGLRTLRLCISLAGHMESLWGNLGRLDQVLSILAKELRKGALAGFKEMGMHLVHAMVLPFITSFSVANLSSILSLDRGVHACDLQSTFGRIERTFGLVTAPLPPAITENHLSFKILFIHILRSFSGVLRIKCAWSTVYDVVVQDVLLFLEQLSKEADVGLLDAAAVFVGLANLFDIIGKEVYFAQMIPSWLYCFCSVLPRNKPYEESRRNDTKSHVDRAVLDAASHVLLKHLVDVLKLFPASHSKLVTCGCRSTLDVCLSRCALAMTMATSSIDLFRNKNAACRLRILNGIAGVHSVAGRAISRLTFLPPQMSEVNASWMLEAIGALSFVFGNIDQSHINVDTPPVSPTSLHFAVDTRMLSSVDCSLVNQITRFCILWVCLEHIVAWRAPCRCFASRSYLHLSGFLRVASIVSSQNRETAPDVPISPLDFFCFPYQIPGLPDALYLRLPRVHDVPENERVSAQNNEQEFFGRQRALSVRVWRVQENDTATSWSLRVVQSLFEIQEPLLHRLCEDLNMELDPSPLDSCLSCCWEVVRTAVSFQLDCFVALLLPILLADCVHLNFYWKKEGAHEYWADRVVLFGECFDAAVQSLLDIISKSGTPNCHKSPPTCSMCPVDVDIVPFASGALLKAAEAWYIHDATRGQPNFPRQCLPGANRRSMKQLRNAPLGIPIHLRSLATLANHMELPSLALLLSHLACTPTAIPPARSGPSRHSPPQDLSTSSSIAASQQALTCAWPFRSVTVDDSVLLTQACAMGCTPDLAFGIVPATIPHANEVLGLAVASQDSGAMRELAIAVASNLCDELDVGLVARSVRHQNGGSIGMLDVNRLLIGLSCSGEWRMIWRLCNSFFASGRHLTPPQMDLLHTVSVEAQWRLSVWQPLSNTSESAPNFGVSILSTRSRANFFHRNNIALCLNKLVGMQPRGDHRLDGLELPHCLHQYGIVECASAAATLLARCLADELISSFSSSMSSEQWREIDSIRFAASRIHPPHAALPTRIGPLAVYATAINWCCMQLDPTVPEFIGFDVHNENFPVMEPLLSVMTCREPLSTLLRSSRVSQYDRYGESAFLSGHVGKTSSSPQSMSTIQDAERRFLRARAMLDTATLQGARGDATSWYYSEALSASFNVSRLVDDMLQSGSSSSDVSAKRLIKYYVGLSCSARLLTLQTLGSICTSEPSSSGSSFDVFGCIGRENFLPDDGKGVPFAFLNDLLDALRDIAAGTLPNDFSVSSQRDIPCPRVFEMSCLSGAVLTASELMGSVRKFGSSISAQARYTNQALGFVVPIARTAGLTLAQLALANNEATAADSEDRQALRAIEGRIRELRQEDPKARQLVSLVKEYETLSKKIQAHRTAAVTFSVGCIRVIFAALACSGGLPNNVVDPFSVYTAVSLWLQLRSEPDISAAVDGAYMNIPSFFLVPLAPQLISCAVEASRADAPVVKNDDAPPHPKRQKVHASSSTPTSPSLKTSFSEVVFKVIKRLALDHPCHVIPTIWYSCKHKSTSELKDVLRSVTRSTATSMAIHESLDAFSVLCEKYSAKLPLFKGKTTSVTTSQLCDNATLSKAWGPCPLVTMTVPLTNECVSDRYGELPIPVQPPVKGRIMFGNSAPLLLICTCSDGVERGLLIKTGTPTEPDEVRQDAVMLSLIAQVNVMLSSDCQKAQRQRLEPLSLYNVRPLSDQGGGRGLLEFVLGSPDLSSVLKPMYSVCAAITTFGGITKCELLEDDATLQHYRSGCQELDLKVGAMLPRWMSQHQATADLWHMATVTWARSYGAACAVGFILGLGDRHLGNVLISRSTGKVTLIDFGYAWDVSFHLKIPETVPFRLTREMLAGCGITGSGGPFAYALTETLRIMRGRAPVFRTMLEVLRADPMTSWNPPKDSSRGSPQFKMIEARLNSKLRGEVLRRLCSDGVALDPRSQAAALIEQATLDTNLAYMYSGWSPML